MKKVAAIFCFLAVNFLVTANPLGQIVPLQSCPCNQNGFTAPLNLPVVLQQPNMQQLPPWMQPPSDNNFYSQPILLQNQVPSYQNPMTNQASQIPSANQVNPVTNQISQMYMQKILSNPTIQSILESNSRLYNQFPEIPYSNGQASGNAPNVVNNYFILPPEFLNDEFNGPPKRKSKTNERNTRPNQENNNYRRRPSRDFDEHIDPYKNQSRRRENRKSGVRNEDVDRAIEYLDDTTDRRRNRRREKDRVHNNRFDMNNHRNNGPGKPKDRKISHNDRDAPIPKSAKEIYIKFETAPKDFINDQKASSKERTDLNESKEQGRATVRKDVNAKDEAVIEDFRRKFPGIPEEVVRSLLKYLRRQLQREMLGRPWFYSPDVTFPLRFDQLFPNSRMFDFQRNDGRRRPNRRNPGRKPRPKQDSVNLTTTDTEPTTRNPTTTQILDITTTTSAKSDIDKNQSNEIENINEKPEQPEPFETTTKFNFPELGTEDEVEDINNGIIDDYFPNFRSDKAYFESEEVNTIRNLRDNRYHYTTDRNFESESYKENSRRFENSLEIEDSLRRPFDIERNTFPQYVEREIMEFRTPPPLEMPDFITKKVEKVKSDSDRTRDSTKTDLVLDKSSAYSEAKNSHSNDIKTYKINIKSKKPKVEDIETLQAHSKVAQYGKNDEVRVENDNPVVTYYIPENMQFENDGRTVIAKTIPADYFW